MNRAVLLCVLLSVVSVLDKLKTFKAFIKAPRSSVKEISRSLFLMVIELRHRSCFSFILPSQFLSAWSVSMVVQSLALFPQSKKILGSNPPSALSVSVWVKMSRHSEISIGGNGCLSLCDRLITCPGASPPMAVGIGSNPEDPEENGLKRIQRALDPVVAMMPFDATYNMKVSFGWHHAFMTAANHILFVAVSTSAD